MKITSHQLLAFYTTVTQRNFTKAADALAITQSALSQRISQLEKDLEVTLFIRDPSGPILTTAGEKLLRHCQVTDSLEQEILSELKTDQQQFAGQIRIAGFSSVLRSVIIPSLAQFLRDNRKVNCEFRSYEVIDLPKVLRNAEADFIILDYRIQKKGIAEHVLGKEEYVVIESSKFNSPTDIYLDHGPHDNATESFFTAQASSKQGAYRRSFMGDVYGIINGVEQGLGRAVMSKHLIEDNSKIKLVKGYKPYYRDIVLNYFEQPYYSKLHKEIIRTLEKSCSVYL